MSGLFRARQALRDALNSQSRPSDDATRTYARRREASSVPA
jgi:hypothetical protein